MIYILAILFPPLALLLEGRVLGALLALFLSLCALVIFLPLYLAVGVGACVVIAQRRKRAAHRELLGAVREGRAKGGVAMSLGRRHEYRPRRQE